MKDKKDNNSTPEPAYTGKTYAYIAIGLLVAGVVAAGLIFTALGIYALIAAILCSLGSLAFAGTQKKKNNFSELKIIQICGYVLLAATIALFVGGIIWAETANHS